MECPIGEPRSAATRALHPSEAPDVAPVSARALDAMLAGTPPLPARSGSERVLRCVSSGYLSHGCSCDAAVPAQVVIAAWAIERSRERSDRFFSVSWGEQVWLGYGLRNGRVRGVYCPEHRAERGERTTLERLERDAQPALHCSR